MGNWYIKLSQTQRNLFTDEIEKNKPYKFTTRFSRGVPKSLMGLAAEARKSQDFEEFEKNYSHEIKHGLYWHVSDNPNFSIDLKKGPRDMSSMGGGGMTTGKLMVTSDLPNWVAYYGKSRSYAALIDMSMVPSENYSQVNRGFGNEFYVDNPLSARVIEVMPVSRALAKDRQWKQVVPKSKEELKDFYYMSLKL